MSGAWGPIEFSATDIAVFFLIAGLVPPLVVAVVGSLIHALVLARQGGDKVVTMMPLFLKWWLWCTVSWVGAWLFGIYFT